MAKCYKKGETPLEANEYGYVYSSVVCERFVAPEEKALTVLCNVKLFIPLPCKAIDFVGSRIS